MRKYNLHLLLAFANLVVINWVLIRFVAFHYPMLGHDYAYAIPQMLDTFIHYKVNGLSIQWYTPSFGGGLPAFPNPNNSQFSILEVLTLWMSPWQAVILSTIFFVSVGGLASFYLFRKVLDYHWTTSLLGMVFFSANGFIMERVTVGHLGYQTFPLLALILVLLLECSLPWGAAALIFALVVTLIIHQAGYSLIVIFGLSLLLILPLVYILRPKVFSWKRIVGIIGVGGGVALLMSASKLAAVYAFMRFFPREMADTYLTTPLLGLFGILLQLLGTMNLVPLLWVARVDPALLPKYMVFTTGAGYGYWEFDMSLSPVVFIILIFGLYNFLRRPRGYFQKLVADKRWLAWLSFFLFTWIAIEFTLADGWLYPYLRKLPILGSMHVNSRFAVVFLFPLVLAVAALYNRWIVKWPGRRIAQVFALVNILTLLPLGTFFLLRNDMQRRSYNLLTSDEIYTSIRAGASIEITAISLEENETQALSEQVSNLNIYEPIFGYLLEDFRPEAKPGSVWNVSNGFFNMTNPAGYVFPEINGSRPFERIPVSEKDKLEAFVNHRQPEWKIPLYQQVLDWASGLTFVVVVAGLAVFGLRRLWKLFPRMHPPNASAE
jgi:hypothetical protein